MALAGLTPVGLAFAIVFLLVMLAGVAAVVWHSWISPRRLLAARRKPVERDLEKMGSPTNFDDEIEHPRLGETRDNVMPQALLREETVNNRTRTPSMDSGVIIPSLSTLCKEEQDRLNDQLAIPLPIMKSPKRLRFSTSTQEWREAVWWFF